MLSPPALGVGFHYGTQNLRNLNKMCSRFLGRLKFIFKVKKKNDIGIKVIGNLSLFFTCMQTCCIRCVNDTVNINNCVLDISMAFNST